MLIGYGLDVDTQTEKTGHPHPNKYHSYLTHHNKKFLFIRRSWFNNYGAGVLAYLQ